MATKTKKTVKEATAEKISIPAVIRDPQVAAPAADDALDLLNQLTGAAPVPTEKPSKARATFQLSEEEKQLVLDYVPSKVLAEHFESHMKAVKAEIEPTLLQRFAEATWATKSRPSNPALKVAKADGKADVETMYIVQEKWKVEAANSAEAEKLLVNLGLSPENAKKLVATEMDFQPETYLRNFKELVKGRKEDSAWVDATDAEKAVAKKVLQFVMSMTKEERDVIVRSDANVTVKSGFLERVASYCHTAEQLQAIFKVVKPVAYLKGAKFGISDSLNDRNERLMEKAKEILGNSLGEEEAD